MTENVTKVKQLLNNIDEILCGGALIIMISLVSINVFSRYLFSYSISWAEEVATICFVWAVFLGASATYKNKMDMGIDFFVLKVPEAYRPVVLMATRCALLLITAYIFFMAMVFTKIAWVKPTAVLGVSSSVFNSALVVGFGLIAFYTLRFIYADIVNFKKTSFKKSGFKKSKQEGTRS